MLFNNLNMWSELFELAPTVLYVCGCVVLCLLCAVCFDCCACCWLLYYVYIIQ